MDRESCLRCGQPATVLYTLYDPRSGTAQDVPLCEACYSSHAPKLRRGEIVFRKTRWISFYPPFLLIGSRGAAKATSRALDRMVRSRLLKTLVRAAPYLLLALAAVTSAVIIYSAVWQLMNPDVVQRMRDFYRQHPLVGTGIVGVDPVLPLIESLMALAIGVTLHELAHAFVLRMYGYDVRRVGLIMLGPFPMGAFVEPPGNVERRMTKRQALELAGAGIMANVLVAGIALAGYLWLLTGLQPQNPDALALLLRYWDRPVLLLMPPLLLSALGVPSITTAPEGWFLHSWLGTGYVWPMSVLHHVFLINFWLGALNAMPLRPLDGGYVVPALVPGRAEQYLSMALTLLLALVMLAPVMLYRL